MADKKKAKKQRTDMVAGIGYPDFMHSETVHMKLENIKNLKLGDYVEIKLCGYVRELRAPGEGGYSPSSVSIEMEERSVNVTGNHQREGIKKLAEDVDDELEDY